MLEKLGLRINTNSAVWLILACDTNLELVFNAAMLCDEARRNCS